MNTGCGRTFLWGVARRVVCCVIRGTAWSKMDPVPSKLVTSLGFYDVESGCISPIYNLSGIPHLSHRILYVNGLVLVELREFLCVSVVIMALVVLSRLKPVPEVLLIS